MDRLNLNRLNLDISQYSINELKDIFNIDCFLDTQEITSHFNNVKSVIDADNNLDLEAKSNMNFFLNKVIDKFIQSLDGPDSMELDSDPHRGTFLASNNLLVKNVANQHPIIQNPNLIAGQHAKFYEGRKALDGDVPPGYINPINIKTINKTFNIDSRFRASYYDSRSSSFHFNLPEPLTRVVRMRMINVELPLSIHGLNTSNNCFNVDTSAVDLSYGNYSTPFFDANFAKAGGEIETLMDDALKAKGIFDICFNVDLQTGKSVFDTSGGPHTISFNKDCEGKEDLTTPLPLKLGWLLGFRGGTYTLTSQTPLVSEGLISPTHPNYIYFCINDYTNAGNNGYVATFSESSLSSHILARLNYESLIQDNGQYNRGLVNNESIREYFGPVDIQKLHFQFLDVYGKIVDFNNMDWSCVLSFDILYD
jgi:hypothetical protein